MIKKEKIMSVISGLIFASLIKLVSAAYSPSYYVETGLDFFKNNYGPFFAALLGTSSFDEFLFAKILAFFLLFAVIWMVLQRIELFGDNRPVVFTITLIVSILAIRFMGENQFLVGVLLPYGVLGAAILVFLPLLIYFYFVETSIPGTMLRRTAWIIYFLFFLIMTIMRWSDITDPIKWVYTAGIIFVLLNVLFDKTIHKYFGLAGFAKVTANQKKMLQREVLRQMNVLGEDYKKGIIGKVAYTREMADLKKKYKAI